MKNTVKPILPVRLFFGGLVHPLKRDGKIAGELAHPFTKSNVMVGGQAKTLRKFETFAKLCFISFFTISFIFTQTQLGGDIDGEATDDLFGHSVSLSSDGNRVAIGAYWNDGNGSNSGHVRVYEYSGGSWNQLGNDIDGEAPGDESGRAVSLSPDGSRVAIGARENDGNGSASGHVRVYEYSGGNWTQLGNDIDGEAAGDQAGKSVSLSSDGSRVAIGAYLNDGAANASGHVRVYEYSSGSWMQLGSDIDGDGASD